jgi:hypothetical protein
LTEPDADADAFAPESAPVDSDRSVGVIGNVARSTFRATSASVDAPLRANPRVHDAQSASTTAATIVDSA